jgi:hypothetical protein
MNQRAQIDGGGINKKHEHKRHLCQHSNQRRIDSFFEEAEPDRTGNHAHRNEHHRRRNRRSLRDPGNKTESEDQQGRKNKYGVVMHKEAFSLPTVMVCSHSGDRIRLTIDRI